MNAMRKIWAVVLMVILLVQSCLYGQVYSRATSRRPENTRDVIEKIRQYPRDGGLFLQLKKMIVKEQDPAMRQQGLAVYALGAMLRGKISAGMSARKLLRTKYPESAYSRALSIEYIGRRCEACAGEGRIDKPCPVCNGDGLCPMCDGTGRIQAGLTQGEDVNCPKCGGTGECEECSGSGKDYRDCHRCKGMGVVLDKSRLKSTYTYVLADTPERVFEAYKGSAEDRYSREQSDKEDRAEEEEEEDVLQYF